jgi:hypothetical protein
LRESHVGWLGSDGMKEQLHTSADPLPKLQR